MDVARSLSQDPSLEPIQRCSRLKASSPVRIHLENCFKKLKSEVTFPMPGLSLILDTALRRHGGAGGGQSCRMPLKLVAYIEKSCVCGRGGWYFFLFEDRLSFCAALYKSNSKKGQCY